MTSLTLPRPTAVTDGSLRRFQRKVSQLVAKMVVTDDDGEKLCELTARAPLTEPLPTLRSLLLGLVQEWAKFHDAVRDNVRSRCFGHLEDTELDVIGAVMLTGTALLTGVSKLHNHHSITDTEMQSAVIDMGLAMKSLALLQASYVENLSDESLDALARNSLTQLAA